VLRTSKGGVIIFIVLLEFLRGAKQDEGGAKHGKRRERRVIKKKRKTVYTSLPCLPLEEVGSKALRKRARKKSEYREFIPFFTSFNYTCEARH
jgi:hypothetical protein